MYWCVGLGKKKYVVAVGALFISTAPMLSAQMYLLPFTALPPPSLCKPTIRTPGGSFFNDFFLLSRTGFLAAIYSAATTAMEHLVGGKGSGITRKTVFKRPSRPQEDSDIFAIKEPEYEKCSIIACNRQSGLRVCACGIGIDSRASGQHCRVFYRARRAQARAHICPSADVRIVRGRGPQPTILDSGHAQLCRPFMPIADGGEDMLKHNAHNPVRFTKEARCLVVFTAMAFALPASL